MASETIDIARFAVETAQNIAGLKNNIKELKTALDDENLSWEQQQKVLAELQTNQAALRNAMHGTTASLEDTAKAAKGLGTSYNALVKQMADLTQEFRATEDVARRNELAKSIKAINDQLKDMDASRGIYGRNVGDYFNQISEAGKAIVRDLPSGLGVIKKGLDDTTKSLALMGRQPILGIIALLAPVLAKIAGALKDNETAMGAVEKIGKALQPVAQFFAGIIEKIAGWLAKAVDWVLQLGEQSGISFKTIVSGAVGVGNTILQFILTPVRQTIEAVKGMGNVLKDIFTGQFKKAGQDAKAALNGIGDAFKKGIDFKGNFESGKAAGEAFIAGLTSTKKKAGQAAKEISQEVETALQYGADRILKIMEAGDKARQEQHDAFLADLAASEKETADEIAGLWEDYERERDEQEAKERDRIEARKTLLSGYASAVSDILGSIADMMEDDDVANEKSAQQAKALRTASAIIDTIAGAIAAYMGGVKALGGTPAGIALGAVQAATVLAAGMANVKKIQSTKVGSGGGGSGSVPAITMAPAAAPSIQQTRTITGASEVDRLNRMADTQRVVLVWSDLELKEHQKKVQIVETAF